MIVQVAGANNGRFGVGDFPAGGICCVLFFFFHRKYSFSFLAYGFLVAVRLGMTRVGECSLFIFRFCGKGGFMQGRNGFLVTTFLGMTGKTEKKVAFTDKKIRIYLRNGLKFSASCAKIHGNLYGGSMPTCTETTKFDIFTY